MNLKIENGKVTLIKHRAEIRQHYNFEHTDGITHELYLTDSEWTEWREQQIPKHKRYELINHEDLDVSDFAWLDGADVSGEPDPLFTANEMAKYRSREEYEASRPENQAAYQIDTDYRISKLELGI